MKAGRNDTFDKIGGIKKEPTTVHVRREETWRGTRGTNEKSDIGKGTQLSKEGGKL